MVDVQERVARLEGRVEGHGRVVTDIAATVRHLDARIERFEARMEQRFAGVDLRFTSLEQKVGDLDRRFETGFLWVVGIQFAILMAIVAASIGS